MKKLIFMLIAVLGMTLVGCSWFDSDPIEPNIIGTGNLQYEAKSSTWFVVIDSTQYTVARITIPESNPRSAGKTQSIKPVEGMLVTVFTSTHLEGVQAVTGEQSVEQIEELYRTNSTLVLVLFGVFLLCVMGVVSRKNEEVPVVNADV